MFAIFSSSRAWTEVHSTVTLVASTPKRTGSTKRCTLTVLLSFDRNSFIFHRANDRKAAAMIRAKGKEEGGCGFGLGVPSTLRAISIKLVYGEINCTAYTWETVVVWYEYPRQKKNHNFFLLQKNKLSHLWNLLYTVVKTTVAVFGSMARYSAAFKTWPRSLWCANQHNVTAHAVGRYCCINLLIRGFDR